ncbi:MAG: hypothetical protein CMK42_00775 [Porticoccaceae bacterium]|nr:hypothetical protein [Porticoccaceae bacterium]
MYADGNTAINTVCKPTRDSFRSLRPHDLRHTFATKLRRKGGGRETRKDPMDHVQVHVKTLYNQAEVS